MSAKKGFEIDENTDSGFLSGPIDRFPDEEDNTEESRSDNKTEESRSDSKTEEKDDKSAKQSVSQINDLDSGLDLCLSECLDHLRVEDSAQVPTPGITITGAELPPLSILFQQDDDGDTQLHIAAVHGCQKSVGTLVSVCPVKYLLDVPNAFGHTALHLSVLSGHAVVSRMLVLAGAALGARDVNGDTPLHLATAANDGKCLQALLAPLDAHPPTKRRQPATPTPAINQKNYDGQACVHIAARSGHWSALQTLVFYGADINAKEDMGGWTALHIAARSGDGRLLQHVASCAGATLSPRDYAGRTPRRLAVRAARALGRPDDAQRLLAALPEDSDDSDQDSDDENDSDESESVEALFDKLKGTMSVASLVN